MSKNLSKYASLHRLTLEVSPDVEDDAPLSDDRKVVASVGAAVMALGMGLSEMATSSELPDSQVHRLLELSSALATPAAVGFDTLVEIESGLTGTGNNTASITKDFAQDQDGIDVFTMGLREVSTYVAERPKPIPLAEQATAE